MNDGETYTTSRGRLLSSANFTDDLFIDIVGTNWPAFGFQGASATLLVHRCTFQNCSLTSLGGAIYINLVGFAQIINTTMRMCSGSSGGAVYVQSAVSCISFRTCLFDECKATGQGGGLHLSYNMPMGNIECQSGSNVDGDNIGHGDGLIVGCSFDSCSTNSTSSSYGGGGIYWATPPNTQLIRSCLFSQCSAPARGGALDIYWINDPSYETLVHDLFFDLNTLTGGTFKQGSDVSFGSNNAPTNPFTKTVLVNSYTTSTHDYRIYCQRTCTGFSQDWLPILYYDRFVSGDDEIGSDVPRCSWGESEACRTIWFAVKECNEVQTSKVILLSDIVESKEIKIGEKDVILEGGYNTLTTGAIQDAPSLFSVSSGRLMASSLNIIHDSSITSLLPIALFTITSSGTLTLNQMFFSFGTDLSESTPFSTGMVVVSGGGGDVVMTEVEWNEMYSTKSLITVEGEGVKEVEIESSSFTSITPTGSMSSIIGGDGGVGACVSVSSSNFTECGSNKVTQGGVMSLTLSSTTSFKFISSNITSCAASPLSGLGGGLFLYISDASTPFTFTAPTFATNTARYGENLFVDAVDLPTLVTNNKLSFIPQNDEPFQRWMGYDNHNTASEIPLVFLLRQFTGTAFVAGDSNGHDIPYCGTSKYPCASVVFAQEVRFPFTAPATIRLTSSFVFDTEHNFSSQEMNIDVGTNGTTIAVCNGSTKTESAFITIKKPTTFAGIEFLIPSGLDGRTAFVGASASVTLTDCMFSLDTETTLGYSIVLASGGTLTLTRVGMQPINPVVLSGPFIGLSGTASGSLSGVVVGDLRCGGFPLIKTTEEAKLTTVENTTFTDISRMGGNGCVVEYWASSGTMTIMDVSLSGCSVRDTDSCGGGMFITINGGTVVSTNLSLLTCGAPTATNGKGGGMFLYIATALPTFTMTAPSFNDNTARYGQNLFIDAVDLKSAVTERCSAFISSSDSPVEKWMGYDSNDGLYEIPLGLFFETFTAPALVDSTNGYDHVACGSSSNPCKTIEKAVSEWFGGEGGSISLLPGFVFDEEITVGSNVLTIGVDKKGNPISVGNSVSGSGGVVKVAKPTRLENVSFTLPSSLGGFHTEFVWCSSASLTVADCSIGLGSGVTSISFCLFGASGGTLTIEEFVCTLSVKLTAYPLVIVNGSSTICSIDGMELSLITTSAGVGRGLIDAYAVSSLKIENTKVQLCTMESCSCIWMDGCHTVEISKINFTTNTRNAADGCCISLVSGSGIGSKVNLIENSFRSCCVEEDEKGGGGIWGELKSGCEWRMNECKFTSCTAPFGDGKKGKGGGIMLELEVAKPNFIITLPTFTNNNAALGKDLFLISPSLENSVNATTLPFLPTEGDLSKWVSSTCGFNEGNETIAIPLVYFLQTLERVLVKSNGNDVKPCGFVYFPCKTVNYVWARGNPSDRVLDISESVVLSKGQTFTGGPVTMSGKSSADVVFVDGDDGTANGFISSDVQMTINTLTLSLPKTIGSRLSLFECKSNTLALRGCCVVENVSGSGIEYCIAVVKGIGRLVLSSTRISNVRFGSSCVIELKGSTSALCDLTMCNLDGVGSNTRNGLIVVGKGTVLTTNECAFVDCLVPDGCIVSATEPKKVELKTSAFCGIGRLTGNGGCVSLAHVGGSGLSVMVDQCSFKTCCVTGGPSGGGAVYASFTTGLDLIMRNSTFEKCTAPEEPTKNGRGGGIYLVLGAYQAEFMIEAPIFTNNQAWKGKDVFVSSQNIYGSALNSRFPFFKAGVKYDDQSMAGKNTTAGGDVDGPIVDIGALLQSVSDTVLVDSLGGSDEGNCGLESHPCRTFEKIRIQIVGDIQTVKVAEKVEIKETYSFERGSFAMRGHNGVGIAEIKLGPSVSTEIVDKALLSSIVNVVFGEICFKVPATLNGYSFVVGVEAGKLRMQDCSFERSTQSNSGLDFGFLSVSNGYLDIDGLEVNEMNLASLSPLVIVSSSAVEMNGLGVESVAISADTPLIVIDGCSLEIGMSSFSGIRMTNGGVVEVVGGSCVLATDVSFNDVVAANVNGGCLSLNCRDGRTERLNITGCLFDKCRTYGEVVQGGGLSVAVGEPTSLSIQSCSFKCCTIPSNEEGAWNGMGGGMYLCLSGGSVTFDSTTEFKDNHAWKGNDFFLSSPNLTKAVNSAIQPTIDPPTDPNSFVGQDGDGSGQFVPLAYFVCGGPDVVEIQPPTKDGRDFGGCGWSGLPCESLVYALNRQRGKKRSVAVIDSTKAGGRVVVGEKPHEVVGIGETEPTVIIEDNESIEDTDGFIQCSQNLSISWVKFVIPISFTKLTSLMEIDSAESVVSLNNLAIELGSTADTWNGDGLTFALINVKRGILTVSSLKVENGLRFDGVPIMQFDSRLATGTIVELIVLKCTLNGGRGMIECSNNGWVELIGCVFSDISFDSGSVINNCGARGIKLHECKMTGVKRKERNGSVIEADVGSGGNVIVSSCEVEGCGVNEKGYDGGGMMIALGGTGAVNITDSTIRSCFVSEANGRGGGVCLKVGSDSINAFQFSEITFASNVAKSGKNVFLWAHDLVLSAQQSRFQFVLGKGEDEVNGRGVVNFNETDKNIVDMWIHRGSTIYVASSGTSHAVCGTDLNPCSTVDGAVTKLDGKANQLLVTGGESVSLEGKAYMSGVVLKSTDKEEKAIIIVKVAKQSQGEGGLVVNNGVFELLQIEFVLTDSIGCDSLIESGGTTLSLDCISFIQSVEKKGIADYSLLNVRKGRMEMTSVAVDGIGFDSPVFMFGNEVENANVEKFNCSSITLYEYTLFSFVEQSSTQLTISSSNFTSINTNSTTNGILLDHCLLISMERCSFTKCGSQSEQGSIVSFGSSLSVSVTYSTFDGTSVQEDNLTSDTNTVDEGVCSWNGSIVHFEHVENAVLDLITVVNSSKGGLSAIASNVTIIKGEFEGNNPMIGEYLSARRNIICKDDDKTNTLTISSLKGGDGQEKNTSLWILNDGCVLEGIPKQRASEFFIPTLTNVADKTDGLVWTLALIGSHFLPCALSFNLSKIDETGNATLLTNDSKLFSVQNETTATISAERDIVDGVDDDIVLTLLFGSNGATEPYLIEGKKQNTNYTSDEPMTRATNTPTESEYSMLWPFIVVTSGLVGTIIFTVYTLSTRKKAKKEQINTNKEDYSKDEEMKEDECCQNRNDYCRPDESNKGNNYDRSQAHRQDEKSMSQQRLLPYKGESDESSVWKSGFTGDTSDNAVKQVKSAGQINTIAISTGTSAIPPPQTSSIPMQTEKTMKGKEKEVEQLPPTTSSLGSLVEGHACHSPFEVAIVDQRDSLFLGIRSKARIFEKERTIDKKELEKREDEVNSVVFWIVNGIQHLFENEIGKKVLITLNPNDIFYGADESFVIGLRPMGVSEAEKATDQINILSMKMYKADTEMHRWMAPELINGAVREATEGTLSFAIGMITYYMLSYRVPFDDLLGVDAGIKILEGWRPNMDDIRKSQYWPVMMACTEINPHKRPTIVQLKRAFLGPKPTPSEGVTKGDIETHTSTAEEGGDV